MAGRIVRVSGPLVVAEGLDNPIMYGVVKVGTLGLFGEIISLGRDTVSIQVYEQTEGVGPGEPVEATGDQLSVELGPGLMSQIYDGIQRPLDVISEGHGSFIARGIEEPAIDYERRWEFTAVAQGGSEVVGGARLGFVQETEIVKHWVMVPPGLRGTITSLASGTYTVTERIGELEDPFGQKHELKLAQRWPVRQGRPYRRKLNPGVPLVTGQRVLDTFFPLAKGGTGCVPGPFGSGKTVVQQQLSKWADADIIVYVGCGERGNEMTDVLIEFPELTDPKSGRPLMERTTLIANTSNMPVAAREASVFTGITIAEYYRDMGYDVALMADSTSRWAEAMREISGRLEEMPGEEGYPAYLASRIAQFYERAGRVYPLGATDQPDDDEEASLSVIGAVSPPGGDLSDPVVQGTLREVRVFWSLRAELAYARHFPAVDWLTSYSLYGDSDALAAFYRDNVSERWLSNRAESLRMLQEEADLQEIVRLVGLDAISAADRLLLETTRAIREAFLQQNAFHDVDTFTPLAKQYLMLDAILQFHHGALARLDQGVALDGLLALPVRERIARMKFTPQEDEDDLRAVGGEITQALEQVAGEPARRAS
ncbi:MAG: V-type ATP synthase subunit A [Spirochaetaceae bacterium]|nr:V-type ATP synthase subunit A [Spirochaetaceae bacterium]